MAGFSSAGKLKAENPAEPIRPKTPLTNEAMVSEAVEVTPTDAEEAQERQEQGAVDDRAEDCEEEFKCQECLPRRILPDPGQPTARQLAEHRIDHIPYRSWCPECVAARATGEQHRTAPGARTITRFSFDYLFITRNKKVLTRQQLAEGDEVELKVLVAKDAATKAIFAHVVPQKGCDEDGYAVGRLVEDVQWLGHQRLELKSDNEKAILKLLRDSLLSMRVEIPDMEQLQEENAVTYDSKSNGDAENAVKQVQKQLRTLKLCLEKRLQRRIPTSHPVVTWLVEHAAWLLTTRQLGEDGFTSYQRAKGRDFAKRTIAFAERVMYMLPSKGPQHDARAKLDPLWEHGVVLGYSRTSAEYFVYSDIENKVIRARSLQRVPEDRRWSVEHVEKMLFPVQHWFERREARAVQVEGFRKDDELPEMTAGRSKTQRVALYREDYVQHGITDDCKKCISNQRHGYNLNAKGEHSKMVHTERCRRRLEAALASTEAGKRRLQAARDRVDAWMARAIEEADVHPEGEKRNDGVDGVHIRNEAPQNGKDGNSENFDDNFEENLFGPRPAALANPAREMAQDSISEDDMAWEDVADGDQAPLSPPPPASPSYSPSSPARAPESDDEMITLLETMSGRPEARAQVHRDSEEILRIVRDLGGSRDRYRRERTKAVAKIVSEIYSAPRVTKVLKMMPTTEVCAGFALDLTTEDENGIPWDFTRAERREAARSKIIREKPMFLIGSPACSPYSSLQVCNKTRAGAKRRIDVESKEMSTCASSANYTPYSMTKGVTSCTSTRSTRPHGS